MRVECVNKDDAKRRMSPLVPNILFSKIESRLQGGRLHRGQGQWELGIRLAPGRPRATKASGDRRHHPRRHGQVPGAGYGARCPENRAETGAPC